MERFDIDIKGVEQFVSASEIEAIIGQTNDARDTLLSSTGEGSDFLGWIDIPLNIDRDELTKIKEVAERLSKRCDTLVVIGIGGSYLGTRAVVEALQCGIMTSKPGFPEIIYAGHTLSEDYYNVLLNELDKRNYCVAVISKSGTTTEPAVAFRIIKNHIETKYGKEEARNRVVAITDKSKGALLNIARQENYDTFVIPDNVGGRYSVLTPVGLLPIAIAGYDIDALLEGAAAMRQRCVGEANVTTNPAMLYAAVRNVLYRKGYKIEFLNSFLPALRYLCEWWKQLYGESEGKQHKGLLPHSLTFTTDLHSMGQYVQDGERLMFETFLGVESAASKVQIPHDITNVDGLNYLENKSLTEINHCAEQGTIKAHLDGGVPVIRISVPCLNEKTMGSLIYFFEFACGVSGYLLGVNPFNQPGVEAYKRNMFELLGKPGYEKH